ncbi:hypothetical protein CRUP_008566 [Coryphaenoides rupestris]|nr:hypothetical protein CRUP_008566 [Coryphaenoides rupestris]
MVVVVAAVFGDVLDNYAKTEGAWILSLRRRAYAIGSVQECATKCDTEENFVCKSFMYIEKDEECWTAADNSKTEQVIRRASAALYENKGSILAGVRERNRYRIQRNEGQDEDGSDLSEMGVQIPTQA